MYNKLKLASLFLCAALPFSLHAESKTVLPIETWQTPQGTKVYYVGVHELPMVDVDVMFNAGSAYDGKSYGLASLTNGMLDEGAGKLNADEIAEQFDETGAVYGINSTRDSALVSLRTLVDDKVFTPSFNLFTTVLSNPTFPEKNFQRLKNQTLQGIKQQEQDPDTVASNTFIKALYQDAPYGHPTIGNANTVSALKTSDVKSFYEKYYVASNAVITIVGDVDRAKAEKIAEDISSKLRKADAAPALTEPTMTQAGNTIAVDFPATQTTIFMGELGINRLDPQYYPLYVGNYVLGGGQLVSRMFSEVREKRGLTYGAQSAFLPLKQTGPFVIRLETRNEKRDEAISVTKNVLKDFVEKGPTQEEILAAKGNIIGGFPLQFDSNSSISSMVGVIAFYSLPLDYLDTYRDNINKVTQDSILKAFQDKVQLNNLITVTVGPKDAQKT